MSSHKKNNYQLPLEILPMIGQYLDFETRMNYNRAVPFECRVVRKLESDQHNKKVKNDFYKYKLLKINDADGDYRNALIKDLLLYILNTKDSIHFKEKKFLESYIIMCSSLNSQITNVINDEKWEITKNNRIHKICKNLRNINEDSLEIKNEALDLVDLNHFINDNKKRQKKIKYMRGLSYISNKLSEKAKFYEKMLDN